MTAAATAPPPPDVPDGAARPATWQSPYDLPAREKKIILAGSLIGLFLAALDQTIVSTAGPMIQRDLRIAPAIYPWLTTAYLVATTVMVPVYGKLSDQIGRKTILLSGIALFLAGSLLCGFAWSTASLVSFRALQGFGAAALYTSGFSVIADLYPPNERGRYQGLFSAVFGISSLVGPLIGGILTDRLSWHWVFFVNLPLGLLALSLVWNHMPDIHRRVAGERLHVDVVGALLLIFAIAPLLFALSFGRTHVVPGDAGFPWTSPLIVGLFVLGLTSLAGFVLQERRHKEPIVDFGMYGDRVFGVSNAGGFVLGAGFIAGPIFLPLYLVNVLHVSATKAGLSMIPLTLGFVAGAALGGRLGSRLGRVKPILLGAQLLLCVALAIMGLTLSADAAPATVSMRLVLVGLGMGPTLPLFTMAIQNSVRAEQIGVATASITFSRALGQVFGVGVMGSIFAGVIGAAAGVPVEGGASAIVRLAGSAEGREAITQGVRTLFQVGAATALVGLFITQLLPDVRLAGRGPRPAAAAAD